MKMERFTTCEKLFILVARSISALVDVSRKIWTKIPGHQLISQKPVNMANV